MLIQAVSDVNKADKNGQTTLMDTLWGGGRSKSVEKLIPAEADVNASQDKKITIDLLMQATRCGSNECIDLMIEAEADVNQVHNGFTALFWKSSSSNAINVKLLLKKGAHRIQKVKLDFTVAMKKTLLK